jgi:hypothetical protein
MTLLELHVKQYNRAFWKSFLQATPVALVYYGCLNLVWPKQIKNLKVIHGQLIFSLFILNFGYFQHPA